MMSGIPKPCCASGSLHTGTPTGEVKKTHGLDCYVAKPSSGRARGLIVIVPDIFGWALPNNRILADEYAKQTEAIVYLPDFMNGYIAPTDLLENIHALFVTGLWANIRKAYHVTRIMYWYMPFAIRNPKRVVRPRIISFSKAVQRSEAANLPVVTAGFCWGGKYVVELLADRDKADDGKSLVVCGFTVHPSSLKMPDDIEKVVLPLSLAAAEIDPGFSRAQYDQSKKILNARPVKGHDKGVEHELEWYPCAFHGFAVRADEKNTEEAARGKKAEKQAVDWFNKFVDADTRQ